MVPGFFVCGTPPEAANAALQVACVRNRGEEVGAGTGPPKLLRLGEGVVWKRDVLTNLGELDL